MGYKWTSLCKCISFSHRKKASFWRLENSFPTPTHQFDLFLLLKCQLFHLVSFFSYVADWNPSLVKSHHLSQLCQSFTRGGNFLMWLQTLSLSTQTVVFQESNETIWSKDKTFIFSTQKKARKMHITFYPCLHLCSLKKWGNKHTIWDFQVTTLQRN